MILWAECFLFYLRVLLTFFSVGFLGFLLRLSDLPSDEDFLKRIIQSRSWPLTGQGQPMPKLMDRECRSGLSLGQCMRLVRPDRVSSRLGQCMWLVRPDRVSSCFIMQKSIPEISSWRRKCHAFQIHILCVWEIEWDYFYAAKIPGCIQSF